MNAVIRPRAVWTRHYPTARRIAAALLEQPAVLNLRTRRLERDVRERFGVGAPTARTGIAFARAADSLGDSRGTRTQR